MLAALLAKPRVGKVRARRLREDARSRRTADVLFSPWWCGGCGSSHNTATPGPWWPWQPHLTSPQRRAAVVPEQRQPGLPWRRPTVIFKRAPRDTRVPCDRDLSCYTVVIYETWGQRAWTRRLGWLSLSPQGGWLSCVQMSCFLSVKSALSLGWQPWAFYQMPCPFWELVLGKKQFLPHVNSKKRSTYSFPVNSKLIQVFTYPSIVLCICPACTGPGEEKTQCLSNHEGGSFTLCECNRSSQLSDIFKIWLSLLSFIFDSYKEILAFMTYYNLPRKIR